MSEPTVQVPVSLIEDARDAIDTQDWEHANTRAALDALLSQPTPPAATCPQCRHAAHADWCPNMASDNDCSCTHDSNETAEPPRIEDMAPGTTLQVGDESYKIAPSGRILYAGWRLTPWSQQDHQFDPSTIRDVTPPNGV